MTQVFKDHCFKQYSHLIDQKPMPQCHYCEDEMDMREYITKYPAWKDEWENLREKIRGYLSLENAAKEMLQG